MQNSPFPEVYTAREVAEAAGVPESLVRGLLERGELRSVADALPGGAGPTGRNFVAHADAVDAVRALRAGALAATRDASGVGTLLTPVSSSRSTTLPLAVSTTLHALIAVVLLFGGLGFTSAEEETEPLNAKLEPVRLVYLALPGPGGGGGGGGRQMPTPPVKAKREGVRKVSSPIPARRIPPPVEAAPKPPEPPPVPLEARTLPPVMAPVAPIAADKSNQEGVLAEAPPTAAPSQGSGTGGGAGAGQGTGLGDGKGSGIGDGEGGGTGGGPYRPGSGVDPPRLLKEVRAGYTDEARRANVTGEVVLEIVVQRDGTVGDIRILRRLGSGLDQRAVQAVRQWRFAPARLKGVAVDVIVEVAVEFNLR